MSFAVFDGNSASQWSNIITVPVGRVLKLDLYGFNPGDSIFIAKAEIYNSRTERVEAPCGSSFKTTTVLSEDALKLCGCKSLDACRNLGFISIPGKWRLFLNNIDAVGSVEVFGSYIPADQAMAIPEDLFLH